MICGDVPKRNRRNKGCRRSFGTPLTAGVREPVERFGVYRDVFEQSILLNHDANKPWNFVASFGAEVLIVSLVVLIPLAYRDRLPAVHWENVALRPVLAPAQNHLAPARNRAATSSPTLSPNVPRPIFHFERTGNANPAQIPAVFSTDTPPSIGVNSVGDSSNQVGQFLGNLPAPPPPKSPAAHPNTPAAPLHVGGSVQMAKLIRKVIPVYPALARAARISGVVHLIGIIANDGTIRNLQLIDGHPMLAHAALDAVEQWVYEPTLLNGEPVEVIAPIEVSFTLGR
jgi:periplasmic protein TonB